MKTPRELARRLENALGHLFASKKRRIPGLLGDGTTEQRVAVDGADDRVYFRPDPFENAVWEPILRDTSIPAWHGYPVIVEYNEEDSEWYVVEADWNKVGNQEDIQLKYLANHAQAQHVINEDQVPSDPLWVYRRAMVMLRPEVPADGTFRLYVLEGDLPFDDPDHFFAGYGPFLSASLPGSPNQRWVTHYISTEGYVEIEEGTAHAPADAADYPPPAAPAGTVPVAYVLLQYNSSALTESMIWDARRTVGIIGQGTGSAPLSGTNAERIAIDPSGLDEGTQFYTTDTDKVWEVWNSAWRLVVEPSGLSTSDGDSGTPWATDGDGNLIADDGAGDSPQLRFRGGSNDDTISLHLKDDAVADDSDLALTLADTSGDSEFQIADGDENVVARVGSTGKLTILDEFTQQVEDSATNVVTDFQTLEHQTDGTAAAGFGIRHLWKLEDAGGTLEDAGALTIEWENAGAAAEATLFRFWLRKAGVALGPFIEFGATENVFNESSADIDFRVESDGNTHMLFVDAGNDFVGIGTSSPGYPLSVNGASFQFSIYASGTARFVANVGANNYDFSTLPTDPGTSSIRFFRSTNTSGTKTVVFMKGDNTATAIHQIGINTVTIFNEQGDDIDLRIEGDTDQYLFYVDAGNDRIGIGTNTPGSLTEWNFATENLEFVDAGSAGATEQDWIEVQVGNVTGYIRVYAAK